MRMCYPCVRSNRVATLPSHKTNEATTECQQGIALWFRNCIGDAFKCWVEIAVEVAIAGIATTAERIGIGEPMFRQRRLKLRIIDD